MKKLYVSVADTEEKRAKGLMHTRYLDPNKGMLFKFPYAFHLRFWMKNTYIPLDVAFINNDFKVVQIEKMVPLSTKAVTARVPCKYALEVNRGWFEENGVKVGSLISGSLKKDLQLLSQVQKEEPKDKKIDLKVDKPKKDIKEDSLFDKGFEEQPPEMEVEGDYPQSVYTEPVEENVQNPEIQAMRDIRGKIRFAEDHSLEMEVLYWTLRGHMLPPRRLRPLPGEGYPIKSGKSGEFLVAFDSSPTIQGSGWSIKGLQPKSFILDNIIQLQIFDQKGNQMSDQQVGEAKEKEKNPQMQTQEVVPNSKGEQKPSFFDKIKNIFKKK